MPRHFNPKVTQYKQPDHVSRQRPGAVGGSGRRSKPFKQLRAEGRPSAFRELMRRLFPWVR